EAATQHLQQEGVASLLTALQTHLAEGSALASIETAQALIKQVVKEQGVKKGLVMKSLRAALMGDLKGPDLMDSWLILHNRQFDQGRLSEAIAIGQD
ncbi:MAG: glutamate--tRNA ligase, partial [Cyanobacteria bacterium]|nr:glutamate--tRNA ligase [Cyanobacteriota bacterium]